MNSVRSKQKCKKVSIKGVTLHTQVAQQREICQRGGKTRDKNDCKAMGQLCRNVAKVIILRQCASPNHKQ